jgi:hypothetical protein
MQHRNRLLVRLFTALSVATAIAAWSTSALALSVSTLGWDSGTANGSIDLLAHAATTCESSDGGKSGSCSSAGFTPGHGLFTLNDWDSQFNNDPFVTNNFNVTNNSLVTLIFDVIVTQPVVVTGPQTAMSGSVGITLTNTTGTAVLTDASVDVYQALIDGVVVRTLLPEPYSLSCPSAFCTATDSDDFGIFPTPPEIGPQANTDIAIRIRFALSPGDSAGITSVFNIEAVPEPSPGVLLTLGLLGIAIARRSRQ